MRNFCNAGKALVSAITLMLTVSVSASAVCPAPTWTQFAENNDSGTGTRVAPSYYYTNYSGVCDNDPSDLDYVFVYRFSYNCDPDKIRYDNGSRIHSDNLKISRLVLSDDDVHLCMGDNTLFWFYGNDPQVVGSSLKLYKLP